MKPENLIDDDGLAMMLLRHWRVVRNEPSHACPGYRLLLLHNDRIRCDTHRHMRLDGVVAPYEQLTLM